MYERDNIWPWAGGNVATGYRTLTIRLELYGSTLSEQLACAQAHEPEVDSVTPISVCVCQ